MVASVQCKKVVARVHIVVVANANVRRTHRVGECDECAQLVIAKVEVGIIVLTPLRVNLLVFIAASPRAAGQTPGQTPDARAARPSDAAAATPLRAGASSAAPAQEAAGGGLKRSSAEQSLHPEGAPGAAEAEAAGGGWSSARSQGSSSAGRAPSTSSNGMGSEDVL